MRPALPRSSIIPADTRFFQRGVDFSSSGTLSYQWRKEETNIPSAIDRTYIIGDVQTGDAGRYSVVVSDIYGGAVTSSVAMLTVWPLVAPTVLAGPITNPANGRHYYLLNQSRWVEAEAAAVALGGHLATVRNAAENDWLYNTFSGYGGTNRHLWIGLRDTNPLQNASDTEARKAEFAWVSGESATYANWPAAGEPNNWREFGEFYGHISTPAWEIAGFWNDTWDTDFNTISPLNGVAEVIPPPLMSNASLVGQSFSVSVATALGKNYILEYKNSLANPDWTVARTMPGSGGTITFTDNAATSAARFYRIRVQ